MLKRMSALYSNYVHQSKPKLADVANYLDQASLNRIIEREMESVKDFLSDHQYHFLSGNVLDPKMTPLKLLNAYVDVLRTSGPYGADQAATAIFNRLEKLKDGFIPESRHFMLLCVLSTALIKIRVITENAFKLATEKENIYTFSSSKMLQIFEILRQFKPDKINPKNGYGFEETCTCKQAANGKGVVPATYSELTAVVPYVPKRRSISTNEWVLTQTGMTLKNGTNDSPEIPYSSSNKRCARYDCAPVLYQKKHRNFINDDGSALSGLILVDDGFTANILFNVFCELRRHDSDFSFLQPECLAGQGINDAGRLLFMHSLKRFQNRECNLLIATSMMEHKINVQCNLVLQYSNPTF